MTTDDSETRLLAEIETTEAALQDARTDLRILKGKLDAHRLAQRPEFPTPEMLAAIEMAVEHIKAGTPAPTHHGFTVEGHDPARVRVHPKTQWMHVGHQSPSAVSHLGGSLWQFTDDDRAAILAHIETLGFRVTTYWYSDGGLSLTVDRTAAP